MSVDIIAVLALMNRGQAIDEIAREFNTVMDDVKSNGGPGEITIKLKVEPKTWDTRGNLTEVEVSHHLSSKKPRRKLGASTFFVDREGGLSRNNPEQAELFDLHDQNPLRSANDR